MFNKIIKAIHKMEEVVLSLILLYIIVMVLVGVFLRYCFARSIMGSDEIIGYLMVFLGTMGAAINVREDSNICLDALVSKIPRDKQKYLYLPIQILICAVMGYFVYCSYVLTSNHVDVLTPMTRISMGWPYGAMTVGLFFVFFEQVLSTIRKIKDKQLYWPQTDYDSQ